MDKSRKFSGQPILAQILQCIPSQVVSDAVLKHQSNRYYKKLPTRAHLATLMYGVLSFCNGLRELCEGALACEGKLNHLGLYKAPARSTLSDANMNRDFRVFETIYLSLVQKYQSFISDSRLKGLSIRNLKIIDSTTIQLFSEILQGVGRNPLNGGKKKGGIKVHAMMDAFSGAAEFVRITAAKENDRRFLHHIHLPAQSMIVFDKGYIHYRQFAKWAEKSVWFVTRLKTNAVYHVTKVLVDNSKKKNPKGVLKDQYITLGYKDHNSEQQRLKARKITFKAEDGKVYEFMTNNFSLPAKEIAQIYKYRWMIELLFKQIKQNFPIKYFWSDSPNGIRIQVYCVLIAQLLMVVVRKKSATKKSFANMISVIRLHIMSYVNIFEFIKNSYKAWEMAKSPPLDIILVA